MRITESIYNKVVEAENEKPSEETLNLLKDFENKLKEVKCVEEISNLKGFPNETTEGNLGYEIKYTEGRTFEDLSTEESEEVMGVMWDWYDAIGEYNQYKRLYAAPYFFANEIDIERY